MIKLLEENEGENKAYTLKPGDIMVIDMDNHLLSFSKQASLFSRELLYFEDGDNKMIISVQASSLNLLVIFIVKLLGFNRAVHENTAINHHVFVLE